MLGVLCVTLHIHASSLLSCLSRRQTAEELSRYSALWLLVGFGWVSRGWEKGNTESLREGGDSFPENEEMSGVGM